MKVAKRNLIMLAVIGLVGCVSTQENVKIEYQPYQAQYSDAYNMASQTILTRPMYSTESPLRDFTNDEIDEAKTKMRKKRGGNMALLSGSFAILTGNFTGIIDIAGGGVANMVASDHLASRERLMIELPKGEFTSPQSAQQYIVSTLDHAAKLTMTSFGSVKKEKLPNQFSVYMLTDQSGTYNVSGLSLSEVNENTDNFLTIRNFSLKGEMGEFYTYGMDTENLSSSEILAMNLNPMVYASESGVDVDLEKFYKEYTSHLPRGFYLYVPSFPRIELGNKIYTNYRHIVPAIYTEGKQYQFIAK
ncbi:hypothetical protein CAG54_13335 [Vibrio sp. V27_P1S3P104]|uniref:hypothetical protein n=1 Tax=unclassified Vibrio TaxID=2614977 RepID=UPI001372BB43|nr:MULTISPECIES: hypothetical protein [unclassified Vibrio]NAX34084.1 hypothetical protein [Vibrio sp. V29_P1S30P107]NAX38483.1 hypothetical protein [Vibrio sp. V27_P1S3P104]